jgi:DNA-binding NtrC family response regulator
MKIEFRGFPARCLDSMIEVLMHVRDDGEFRVLVVDDEQVIADTLAMILNRSGFVAKTAYSGEAAVMQASQWRPAALISDVIMPGITGAQAAAAILRFLPRCHIILFSGHGTLDIAHRMVECPFEILPKPVHPAKLLQRLKDLRATQGTSQPATPPDPDGVQG